MQFSVFPIGALPSVHPVKKTNRSLLPDELDMTSKSFPAYGIVVLYGPSGSGKTRLMQAAARYFSMQKGFDILHCCVLDLIQEMVDAIKKGTYYAFRASLMRLDALFIDNIWLLQNRHQTALAIFSLLNAFADKGGLVMIASDLPPSLLSKWAPVKMGENGVRSCNLAFCTECIQTAKLQDLTPSSPPSSPDPQYKIWQGR